jgi:hypothetical protein
MANISENPLVRNARGNFGKHYVYRKRGNDTFISRMPAIDKNAVTTEKQEEVRDKFSAAVQYARGVIANPELRKQYQKKADPGKSAYNVAFRDYRKAPKVRHIDPGNYTGSPGSTVVVNAKDDFRVVEVTVTIRNAAGALVEQGKAVLDTIDYNLWIYTATQQNASLAGSIISAVARDLPGNKGTLEVTL